MERQIGETFWDNGLRMMVEATDDITCKGCHYAASVHSQGKKLCFKKYGYVGACLARDREDKTNVIFVCVG